MNIGIDIDGVLTDIQGFNHKYAPCFFMRKFNRKVADENPYDIRDIFQCPESEYLSYWKRYLFIYAVLEPARKGAQKLTQKLYADRHRIYIITKRVLTCRNDLLGLVMRLIVRNWLWRNGITYDKIVFCNNDISDSKRIACLENHIDVMIDDEVVNINAIMPITKVICFDASYNQNCNGVNILRAKNVEEVYNLINSAI